MNKGTGRWAALLVASFVAHTALTVNSSETAVWNEQGRQGGLLAQQLADAAAPLALARDMVSLSVLTSRYENRPGIMGVRLYNARQELIAETGDSGSRGRLFTAKVQLQQQALGQVELRLASPTTGDISRLSLGNIGISFLLHALMFMAGLFLSPRTQDRQRGAMPQAAGATRSAAAPAQSGTPAATTSEEPATITLLHIALDDPNGLLTRVSVSMADELLSLFDQFIDRAARLYGGDVTMPFSPDGVLLRFSQADTLEREFQAIAAGQLFLQLVEDSMEERRRHGLLCLSCKAGLLHDSDHSDDAAAVAALLSRTAPSGRLLSNLPGSAVSTRCHFGTSYRLALSEDIALHVALLENFAPEYQQLIHNQCQHILGPTEAA
ncbi:MAG: hypothetical protein PSX71_10730 [bacterium]|nr:hypothetical protein [bacterium]